MVLIWNGLFTYMKLEFRFQLKEYRYKTHVSGEVVILEKRYLGAFLFFWIIDENISNYFLSSSNLNMIWKDIFFKTVYMVVEES